MQPLDARADPDPRGGRILLSWTNAAGVKGARVLRRESTFPSPSEPDARTVVIFEDFPKDGSAAPAGRPVRFLDLGTVSGSRTTPLKGETVYYYAIVSYDTASNPFPAFVSAMATAPYETGAFLYKNIPSIYHGFDTTLPPPAPALDPADFTKGQLKRLLEMFGLQFDLLRSFAGGMRNFHSPEQIDNSLLPLLAEWIGWQTNFALPVAKQRNEVKYAPHYWATTGTAANLRATINRLVTWNVQFKEFAHNIFLSNDPEQLAIYETRSTGAVFDSPRLVTIDVAFEGRPAACLAADLRPTIFYHARESARKPRPPGRPPAYEDRFQLWYKIFDRDAWLPAHRLTWDSNLNRSPAAFQKSDGTFWLFCTGYEQVGTGHVGRIRLLQLSFGRAALSARIVGTKAGPFELEDGDVLKVIVATPPSSVTRKVAFHSEDFASIEKAKASEVVAVLNREIPGLDAAITDDGTIRFLSHSIGEKTSITIDMEASTATSKLGLAGPVAANGADALGAKLTGARSEPFSLAIDAATKLGLAGLATNERIVGTTPEPFELSDGDVMRVIVATATTRVTSDVSFRSEDFDSITQAHASEVVEVLKREISSINASITEDGRIQLSSLLTSADATITITPSATLTFAVDGNTPREVTFSAAQFSSINEATASEVAAAINLVVPGTAEHDGGKIRLVSLQSGEASLVSLDINRSTAAAKLGFAAPPPATAGKDDAEPAAFEEDATGKVWLFFSSLRSGAWNIWYTRFDGAVWGEPKQLTDSNLPDREPAVVFDPAAEGRIWVFWSRKNASGLWNIFSRRTTQLDFDKLTNDDWTEEEIAPAVVDFDNREPAPLLVEPDSIDLYFSSNRADGFNIWRKSVSSTAHGTDAAVTTGQFTHRGPAPLALAGGGVSIFMRSNESQVYSSSLYPSAVSSDTRYSGSTTSDTRNPARLSLRGSFRDIQRYTHDNPRQDPRKEAARLYSRDTIGIYLTPDASDERLIVRSQELIANVLRRFLPIQVRVVFLIDLAYREFVYSYNDPQPSMPRFIEERMIDTVLGEMVGNNFVDGFEDRANFRFLRTFAAELTSGVLPDLSVSPPDLSFRLPIKGVKEQGV